MTSGGVSRTSWRIVSLSVFSPGLRAIAKLQGKPISSSKNLRRPRVYVSFATTAKLAVPKKSCVTERHKSQTGLIVVCFSRSMKGSGSRCSNSPSVRRNLVVLCSPIGACRYGRSNASHSMRPNSRYMQMFTSASTSRDTSARWLPSGKTMFTSAPMPSTRRRISAKSLGMLKVP